MKHVIQHLLDEDKKIKIPAWAKRVKIDVGTSLNAPNSEMWLSQDSELCVFAFEPNKFNIQTIKEGQTYWPHHIKKERIDYSFFIIETALSNQIISEIDFYCTSGLNTGTSSLFKPTFFDIKEITKVPVITLEFFFNFFPWDKIKYIDQLKIDAQSSDFNIIKGIGNYLSERIVFLDVETTTFGQYENIENPNEIKQYMESNDFECIKWGDDATFLNKKFKNLIKEKNIIHEIL